MAAQFSARHTVFRIDPIPFLQLGSGKGPAHQSYCPRLIHDLQYKHIFPNSPVGSDI